jgi:hypothetical protein
MYESKRALELLRIWMVYQKTGEEVARQELDLQGLNKARQIKDYLLDNFGWVEKGLPMFDSPEGRVLVDRLCKKFEKMHGAVVGQQGDFLEEFGLQVYPKRVTIDESPFY